MSVLDHRLAPIAILLLAMASLWVGLTELPVQDRDEARFAQAARQMAASGDLVDIRFQDAPRYNKPALIYWAQAAVLWISGASGDTPIWLHRIPSYIAGVLSAIAIIWAGTPLVGRRAAVIAGLMCATVYMVQAEARTAKTDAALLLSVTLAMGALARAWGARASHGAREWLTPFIFWTALAAGFLLKGPMVALPVIGTVLWVGVQFSDVRWLRHLRPLPGVIWFFLLAAPWFIAITIVTDGAFWSASVGADLTNKITAQGEHSGSPPGFYLLTIWLTFFPWSILIPLALTTGWRLRRDPQVAFVLGWLIPGWLMFEAVPVKLLHYTLPLYPALMLLAGLALIKREPYQSLRGWALGVGSVGWILGLSVFSVIAVALPVVYGADDGAFPVAPVASATAFAAIGIAGLVALWRDRIVPGIMALALCGAGAGWTLTAVTLPDARQFWIADRLVDEMARFACLTEPVAIAGYDEPSVVFRLGTDTILTDAEGALAFLAAGNNRAAWIDPELLDTRDGNPSSAPEITGTGIGNFESVDLRLYMSPGVPSTAAPCP